MALIRCPECGNEISDKAEKCIHCGCPIKLQINQGKAVFKLLMILSACLENIQSKIKTEILWQN